MTHRIDRKELLSDINNYRGRSTAVIMRGGPGAGKSTFLKSLQTPYEICSADAFRMVDGVYVYNPDENTEVHNRCFQKFIRAVSGSPPQTGLVVGVDNTCIQPYEISPYLAVAKAYSWDAVVVTVINQDYLSVARRNQHGVPEEKAVKMQFDAENTSLPSSWEHYIIEGDI